MSPAPAMRVAMLTALLLGPALACNKGEAGGSAVGSPSAAGAGAERGPARSGSGAQLTHTSSLAPSLVAVASVTPNDAAPCERACGRVGDCLIDDAAVGSFDASRLELECLDLCVHTPADAGARTAFLACEQRDSCGDLLGCARSKWEPLAALRQSPSVQGVIAKGDPCKEGCRWLFSCIYTGSPPGEAYLAPEYEEQVRYCETACDSYGPAEREIYARLAECLPDHCSSGRFDQCMGMY